MDNKYPFERAVADYVASLDERRRELLRTVILNPQAEDDWPWFEEVITLYQLRDRTSPVSRDINERAEPDPYGVNRLWAGVTNTEPIFEALVLINAARKLLDDQPA